MMSASKDVSTSSSDPTPSTSAPALLRVPTTPTMLLKDGTPTPDRLVRDLEESGLLQDFTRSHNPFDETFRRAAAAARSKMESETAAGEEKAAAATGDTLNTPQILASLDTPTIISSLLSRQVSTTSTAAAAAVPKHQTTSAALSSSFVTIAPAKQQVAAQLLLKLPSGDAIHLSDMPVIKQGMGERHEESTVSRRLSSGTSQRASSSRTSRVSAATQGNSGDGGGGGDDDDEKMRQLKERNRMAAHRSREKKKIRALKASNANLSTENYILRQEVSRLKAMLRLHADCPTTVERGEESVVAAEIQSKVVEGSTAAQAMKTTHEQAPKVRIVQVNPFDVAQDMIIPNESSAVALNLSKETRTVTVGEDEPRDILEEAARQIDDPDEQERNQNNQERHQEIGGQPSYIRVTPNSISVKKTKVSSQAKKRTRSESKKKS